MSRDTVLDRFKRNAEKLKTAPALHAQVNGEWQTISWSAYWQNTRRFAGALLGLGYEPGEATVIMGNNCPEWVISDLGTMLVRGVPAGIYQTSTPEQALYIADHCEARVYVIENEEMWTERVAPIADQLDKVEKFVIIQGSDKISHEKVISFDSFLDSGKQHLDAVDRRMSEIKEDDLATLIYTSGTTGPPKGVMLSQKNLSFTAKQAIDLIGGMGPNDCNVSYLPLSHIAEQMFTIHIPLTAGSTVWFCDDIKKVKDALVAARPTIFLGVPRVWEKFKVALEARLAEAAGVKSKIVDWSRAVGIEAGYKLIETGKLSGSLKVKHTTANKLFFSRLKEGLGLDRLRVAVVGAAPIGLDVLEFFLSCGIIINEVYGQSEDSGPTTFNQPRPGWTKLGTAGRPFPGIEVKIADDGEILVKGDNVFQGYYKNPESTKETLVNGWLHSGDIGEFDDDGFLKITDRKKDLLITAGGKNVAPQNIEKLLRRIDGISQAVVIGDRRKFLSALITIDPERAPLLAAEKGWPTDPAELAKSEAFRAHVDRGVEEANAGLAKYETIKKYTLLPDDFTIETGELTPTQKIKRRVVNEKYGAEIEAFYEGLK